MRYRFTEADERVIAERQRLMGTPGPCSTCRRDVPRTEAVWLEMKVRGGRFVPPAVDLGDPDGQHQVSQGCFAFHRDCSVERLGIDRMFDAVDEIMALDWARNSHGGAFRSEAEEAWHDPQEERWLADLVEGDLVAYLVAGVKRGEVDMGVAQVDLVIRLPGGDPMSLRVGCPGRYVVHPLEGPSVTGCTSGRIYRPDYGVGMLIRTLSGALSPPSWEEETE